MSYDDYLQGGPRSFPLRFGVRGKGGQLLWFCGVAHVHDVEDPQLLVIEEDWRAFRAVADRSTSVVLQEGNLVPLEGTRDEAVRHYGERGLVRWLAAEDGVDVISPEPSERRQIEDLLTTFGCDEIAAWWLARHAMHLTTELLPDADLHIRRFMEPLAQLMDVDISVEALAVTYEKVTGYDFRSHLGDLQHFNNAVTPVTLTTCFNRMERRSSVLRDCHIVGVVADLWRRKRSTFIVYGGSHAVIQRAALEALGDPFDAWAQS